MNMETVSEKPKRGRPTAFVPKADAVIRALWPEIGTKRSVRNKEYMSLAVRVLKPDDKCPERYAWFASEGKNHRQAVLVEIGRIASRYGDASAVVMADRLAALIAEGKLSTTREAAACLRRGRLSLSGTPSIASVEALEKLITTAIITYLGEHPDVTGALVQEAL
jgi:hypothetical protein